MLNPFSAKAERHVISPLAPAITPLRGEEGDTGGRGARGRQRGPSGVPLRPAPPSVLHGLRSLCSVPAPLRGCYSPWPCAGRPPPHPPPPHPQEEEEMRATRGRGGLWAQSPSAPTQHPPSSPGAGQSCCLARRQLPPEALLGTRCAPQGGVPGPVPPRNAAPTPAGAPGAEVPGRHGPELPGGGC